MLDLPTTGGRFTWHRTCRGERYVAKKLDRGMANMAWRLNFPKAFVEVLCRSRSDHNPILLRCGGLPQAVGTRSFRFEAAWITLFCNNQPSMAAFMPSSNVPVLSQEARDMLQLSVTMEEVLSL